MTAAPAPARLPRSVRPAIPDERRTRAAGPGAAAATGRPEVLGTGGDAWTHLRRAVVLLPRLVPGCSHASASTRTYGGTRVGSATDSTARRSDALQDELDEGPSLHALRTGHSVLAQDLRGEGRWPRWCDRAVDELGLGSALSVLLSAGHQPVGTLTLYADEPGRLSQVDLALVHRLSEPVARALAAVPSGG